MNLRLGSVFGSAVALAVGVIMLIGLFVSGDLGLLSPVLDRFNIRQPAIITANVLLLLTTTSVAVTIIIGVVNLLSVHLERIVRRKSGMFYSLILLLSFVAALMFYITGNTLSKVLLEDVQVAIESALAGLLFFALVYGAYRMMNRRVTWARVLFVLTILVVLAGALPLPSMGFFANLSQQLMAIPVNAGARGILLGIALGTIVTGVRVLLGQDRSYRE